jgi:Bacteriophage protein of unknown function (DUF646).
MAKELGIKFESPLLKQLAADLRERLSGEKAGNVFTKHMVAAIKAAMKPGVTLLKQHTPKGPTGNLRRSVKAVAKMYKKDRRWFGAVGYSATGAKSKIHKDGYRTGSNLGYHQGLVEFGTKQRFTKGRFASSASRFLTAVNNTKSGEIRTKPKPPKGFFKSAPLGQTVDMGQMQPQKNIPKVYGMADDFMEAALRKDMKTRVEKAWKQLDYLARKKKPL